MLYRFTRFLIRMIFKLIARVQVTGMENIPAVPSFVAVSNHVGRLDAGLAYYLFDRRDIIMLVAEKYREKLWGRWMVKAFDGIWVERFNADLNAMREVLRRLKKGGVMVVAPEGTRSPTGALQEGRDGASYVAAKAGVPVVPVGMMGTEDAVVRERLKRLKRLDIIIHVGQPFTLSPLTPGDRDSQLKQHTAEVMCHIAALLPPSYHGIYADHPRLQALLSENAA
jgi:1-acyl-sn-glycerol-3-phosphate acyltransferase